MLEILLAALSPAVASVIAVAATVRWMRPEPTPPTVVTSEDAYAPELGTPARVEWHRELRDYHRKKLSEAQRAIRADATED